MKRTLAILLSIIAAVSVACAFSSCGDEADKLFYTVEEAFEKDFLSREQIMSIAYYKNGGTKYNETVMGADYTPIPKNPEELSAVTETALKQAYLNEYCKDGKSKLSDVIITGYYGTYNGYVAVMMEDSSSGFFDVITTQRVDDISIFYADTNTIKIWKI